MCMVSVIACLVSKGTVTDSVDAGKTSALTIRYSRSYYINKGMSDSGAE